ncbi:hypothetical protein ACLMPP_00815 [Yersinia enterocolitica]|uniref:hypothetical protein n=1 Tax=Yersinia enterocolitica TaxID=630 RepID=UPI00398D0E37
MKIKGHAATITFDMALQMFRGEFIGLNSGADFYAYSVVALKKRGEYLWRCFWMSAIPIAIKVQITKHNPAR